LLGMPEPTLLHFPIQDLGVPSSGQLLGILATLLQELAAGGCLYVHCWGGLGRAGLVGACLVALLRRDWGPATVLACTQAGCDTRVGVFSRSPQTRQQHALVHGFAAKLQEATTGT